MILGGAIATMHYVGMAAMQMRPGIDYHLGWFAAVMGFAVIGMHYTGMGAARFPEGVVAVDDRALARQHGAQPAVGLTPAKSLAIAGQSAHCGFDRLSTCTNGAAYVRQRA